MSANMRMPSNLWLWGRDLIWISSMTKSGTWVANWLACGGKTKQESPNQSSQSIHKFVWFFLIQSTDFNAIGSHWKQNDPGCWHSLSASRFAPSYHLCFGNRNFDITIFHECPLNEDLVNYNPTPTDCPIMYWVSLWPRSVHFYSLPTPWIHLVIEMEILNSVLFNWIHLFPYLLLTHVQRERKKYQQ